MNDMYVSGRALFNQSLKYKCDERRSRAACTKPNTQLGRQYAADHFERRASAETNITPTHMPLIVHICTTCMNDAMCVCI